MHLNLFARNSLCLSATARLMLASFLCCFTAQLNASTATRYNDHVIPLANGERLVFESHVGSELAEKASIFDVSGALVTESRLLIPRQHHSATALPNGKVLVLGGLDARGALVQQAELFDPNAGRFIIANGRWPLARVAHTVTTLTSGKLLITGGWHPEIGNLYETELFDIATQTSEFLTAELQPPRHGHAATLLADGNVLISGGYDDRGLPDAGAKIFDRSQIRFVDVDVHGMLAKLETEDAQSPTVTVAESLPANNAIDVPLDGLIALRFSKLIDARTVNEQTVRLFGTNAALPIAVHVAEGGRLAFILPRADLHPATTYRLAVNGVTDLANESLSLFAMNFLTKSIGALPLSRSRIEKTGRDIVGASVLPQANFSASPANAFMATPSATADTANEATLSQQPNLAEQLKAGDIGNSCPTGPDSPTPQLTPRGDSTDTGDTDDPEKCDEDCEATSGGDPVDLRTGVFVFERTDIKINDVMPIRLSRVYRTGSNISPFGNPRSFGSATHNYNMYLTVRNGTTLPNQLFVLHGPDGADILFYRTNAGGGIDVVAEHKESTTAFYGARLERIGGNYVITKKDGSKYVFASSGQLTRIEDRYGNYLSMTRANDAQGFPSRNISRINTMNGRFISFSYDTDNRITQITDHTNRMWIYTYDASGNVVKVTYPDGLFESYTYDGSSRMLTVKDRRGTIALTNEYSGIGVSKQTLANGGSFLFSYTMNPSTPGYAAAASVTDPRGNVRRVTFHPTGYKATETFAYGTPLAQTYTYERVATSGLRSAVVDPLGRRTEFVLDSFGNTTQTKYLVGTADQYTTSATFTAAFNQVATSTDPRGKVTAFSYNPRGQLTGVTYPLGLKRTLVPNYDGRPQSVKDGLGNTTTFTYSGGDPASVTDPLNRTTTFFTSALGRGISVINALGRTTQTEYDAMSRVTKITDALGQASTMTYDANGKRLTFTDPKNQTTTWAYDTSSRVVSRKDALLRSETFTYNTNDFVASSTDRKAQVTTRTYDALDRLTQLTHQGGATTKFTYDAGDRLLKIDDSVSGVITRSYDLRDRLMSETTPQGSVAYTYDAASRRTGMTVTGQPAVTYAYDDANRLLSITQNSKTITYTYDNANRLTQAKLGNGVTKNFAYDVASQLTSITFKKPDSSVLGDLIYNYDKVGQIVALTGSLASVTLPPATTAIAAYDANNRLTSWNAQAITYDNQGNMTSASGRTHTWDTRNRLTAITGSAVASFQYDALGRRITKTTPSTGNTATALTYDGSNPVVEKQGTTVTGTNLTSLGIDSYLTRGDTQAGVTKETYPLTDHLGSVIALTDAAGSIVTSYGYEPYGNTTTTGTASKNPHQYTGRENDGTGLYYYRARYYDPKLMRFVSEDPIGLAGGDNSYAYVEGNPLTYLDPLGLQTTVDAAIRNALGKGDVAELQGLLEAANPAQATVIRNGVEKFGSRATDYIAKNCRAKINSEFPGQFKDKTLKEILDQAKAGDSAAKKAWKLLNDNRFQK